MPVFGLWVTRLWRLARFAAAFNSRDISRCCRSDDDCLCRPITVSFKHAVGILRWVVYASTLGVIQRTISGRHRQSQCGRDGMKARGSRLARALGVVGFGALVCGCSETFADQIREHRGCIGEAQISPQTIDACLRNTNGRRQNVTICLVDDMVPDHKIRMLNGCVDAAEHSRND